MTRSRANLMLMLAAFWGAGNVAQKNRAGGSRAHPRAGFSKPDRPSGHHPGVPSRDEPKPETYHTRVSKMATSIVFFCLALGLQQKNYRRTTVTNAKILVNTTVVFTPVFACMMIQERPRLVTVPAVALALGGVLLMSGGLSGLGLGDAYCIVSAVSYSAWIVLVAQVTRTSDRPFTLAAAQFGLTSLLGLELLPLRLDRRHRSLRLRGSFGTRRV